MSGRANYDTSGLGGRKAEAAGRGIILIYHGIGAGGDEASWRERKYWIARDTFTSHVIAMKRQCTLMTLEEFWSSATGTANAVGVTFDDGRVSDYEAAWPVLQAAGAPATFFLNTSTIGTSGYVSWRQVREMQRAGMSIQSHGHDHTYLTRLPVPGLAAYLRDSRSRLEDGLGREVAYFAPPYGDLNRILVETALECGFRAVCRSRERVAVAGSPLLSRVAVYKNTSARTVTGLAMRNPWYLGIRELRGAAIFIPKQIFLLWRHALKPVAVSGPAHGA